MIKIFPDTLIHSLSPAYVRERWRVTRTLWFEARSWTSTVWVQVPTGPHTSHETLAKLLKLFVLPLAQLQNLWGLNELLYRDQAVVYAESWEKCPAHRKGVCQLWSVSSQWMKLSWRKPSCLGKGHDFLEGEPSGWGCVSEGSWHISHHSFFF